MRTISVRVFLLAAMAILGGCQTGRQQVARQPSDAEKCAGYGFRSGSPDYAKCMFSLDQERRRDTDALTNALIVNRLTGAPLLVPVR